eukprot:g18688.t1
MSALVLSCQEVRIKSSGSNLAEVQVVQATAGRTAGRPEMSRSEDGGTSAGTPRRTTQEKLDLPLEDLINERGGGDRSMAGSSREPFAHREGRVQRKVKQMGLILETRHLRRPPVNRDEGEGIEPPRSRPRVKAPPVPQPIARASVPPVKAPPVPFFVRPTASEGMDVDDSANRKEEDLSDEGFEEEENLPGPPPGEHWKQTTTATLGGTMMGPKANLHALVLDMRFKKFK